MLSSWRLRSNWRPRSRRGWFAALLFTALVSFTAGAMLQGTRQAEAEVREEPVPKAFQSGSERSEVVLKEMLAVLKTMDRRLQHFEDVLDRAARE